jgi:AcrR family transcriptional regulator
VTHYTDLQMRVNEQEKAQTRRALLDAATRAFVEHGFHRASIDRVSEEAGLAKGTVYNYFPSKQAVFDTVLLEACTLAVNSANAVPESAPTRVRLEAFVAGNLAWAQENKALALLFAKELIGGDAETREAILTASAPCVDKVAAILRAGSERGELKAGGPLPELALTFIVMANALLLQASQGEAGWPPVETLPATVSGLFLYGVASPVSRPDPPA